jgi:hypothetical protein
MEYIEITQDGGGFLPSESNQGIFTSKVETCSVYTFHGENGYALVHDTGQLKLKDISDFAKKCGAIKRLTYSINPELLTKFTKKENNDRKNKVSKLVGFKGKVEKYELPLGNIISFKESIICSEADFSKDSIANGNLIRIPEVEKRKTINILNNLFSEKNSQMIPLDIQFNDGEFQAMPKLLKGKTEMRERAKLELVGGDSDYSNMLNIAENEGVV